MDLSFTPDEEAFRAECRAWLEAQRAAAARSRRATPARASPRTSNGNASCSTPRYAVVSWPAEYGGRDATLWEWLIFEEEYYRAGAPQRVTQNGIFLLAPTIFEFGTPEQKDRILPKMAAGEQTWCQGWSEPNAGSDLAGIESKAVRDDAAGGWRLSGQKTWTTRGAFCTHLFGLFRSDPDAERHRGLTYFLVDLATPGVTVRGVERLDGDEGFAEVFLDDVFVPDADVLGEPHRRLGGRDGDDRFGARPHAALARPLPRDRATADRPVPRSCGDDPQLRDRLVAAYIDAEAYRWQTFWTVTRIVEGGRTGAESSMVKVFWSELDVRAARPRARAARPARRAARRRDAAWMKGYEFALAGPIYAGTNEIQRNVIAERVLGTPPRNEVRVHRRPARVPRRGARPPREGVLARARARRVDERDRARARPVGPARRHGRRRHARARGRRRARPARWSTSC